MNNQCINLLIFVLVLLLICYFMSKELKRENFSNKFVEFIDIARTKPDSDLIEIKKKDESKGWKKYYKDNYSKGDVDYPDNFEGTIIRNYLDNIRFTRN